MTACSGASPLMAVSGPDIRRERTRNWSACWVREAWPGPICSPSWRCDVIGKAAGRTSDEQITWSEHGNLQGAQFYAIAGKICRLAKAAKLKYEIPTSL